MSKQSEVIIIGGGIAGVSAGAQLSQYCDVTILEKESTTGYHATGRSAAVFAPAYGNEVVRNLTTASEAFYRSPPAGFTEVPLLKPRDGVFIASQAQQQPLANMLNKSSHLSELSADELVQRVPIIDSAQVYGGALDCTGGDLDVDAIVQGFLRQFRSNGGVLICDSEVQHLEWRNGLWHFTTPSAEYCAPTIINAAGAWADEVAMMAGISPLSMKPFRRSALLIDAPLEIDITDWPLVIDVDENFYFKPEAGQLLISPADETPFGPCDAYPDEMDLAIAIDRVQKISQLEVSKINHSWAGLRTFASDKTFVVGYEPGQEGFFWLAGQGGYGVQSAPALADITCHLICGSNNIITQLHREKHLLDITPERFR